MGPQANCVSPRTNQWGISEPGEWAAQCPGSLPCSHEYAVEAFQDIEYWAWQDPEEGERFCGARSDTWDTSFAVQAICEGTARGVAEGFLSGATRYLKQAQVPHEAPHRRRYYQDIRRGGFCFGDERHQWPVSDCTAEALSALSHLDESLDNAQQIEPTRIMDAVRFILSRQNADGGWGSFERRRGPTSLERLNPFEMFANCMVEHSYIECTGSSLHALRRTLDRFPGILSLKRAEEDARGYTQRRRMVAETAAG